MATHSLDELKLVFLYDLVRSIVTADNVVDDREDAFLEALCPPDRMQAAGFLDGQWRTTPAYEAAFGESLEVLPTQPMSVRKELTDACIGAVVADDRFDPREAPWLRRVALLLDVDDATFDAWLVAHPQVGVVDLEPADD